MVIASCNFIMGMTLYQTFSRNVRDLHVLLENSCWGHLLVFILFSLLVGKYFFRRFDETFLKNHFLNIIALKKEKMQSMRQNIGKMQSTYFFSCIGCRKFVNIMVACGKMICKNDTIRSAKYIRKRDFILSLDFSLWIVNSFPFIVRLREIYGESVNGIKRIW